jgi:nitrous oxidase accessory protein NosD
MTSDGTRRPTARGPAALAVLVSATLAALVVPPATAFAATINVNCSTQSLQTKIDSAPGGSTLLITGTCIGNFILDKNLTLKGNPSATLDGNDSGTTLTAPSTHTVHLIALRITGGSASTGAGINRAGAGTRALTLNGVTVSGNVASGTTAQGGGIFIDGGSLVLTNSHVINNRHPRSAPPRAPWRSAVAS